MSPTGQPTRQPTGQPTGQPTRQPTRQPTGQPTGQPTREPTRKIYPSSQPTNQPTRLTLLQAIELKWPGKSTPYDRNGTARETTYWCHRSNKQFHSSANGFQQIFGGLELNQPMPDDYVKSARIWITNWNAQTDSLSMIYSDDTNLNYARDNFIVTNVTDKGVLYLRMARQDSLTNEQRSIHAARYSSVPGLDLSWLPNDIWTRILRMVAYRFFPTSSAQLRCEDRLGKSKTFAIQLTDWRNRVSSVYYHTMRFRTAGIIFTDEVAVLTTNEVHGEMLLNNATLLRNVGEIFTQ